MPGETFPVKSLHLRAGSGGLRDRRPAAQFREKGRGAPEAEHLKEHFSRRPAEENAEVSPTGALRTAGNLVAGIPVDSRIDTVVAIEFGELIVHHKDEFLRQVVSNLLVRQRLHPEGVGGQSAALSEVADDGDDQEGPAHGPSLAHRGRELVPPPEPARRGRRASQSRHQREQDR